ncbi:hypothetical protein V8B97DRAFT_2109560 [Scleroderma yunnanense]
MADIGLRNGTNGRRWAKSKRGREPPSSSPAEPLLDERTGLPVFYIWSARGERHIIYQDIVHWSISMYYNVLTRHSESLFLSWCNTPVTIVLKGSHNLEGSPIRRAWSSSGGSAVLHSIGLTMSMNRIKTECGPALDTYALVRILSLERNGPPNRSGVQSLGATMAPKIRERKTESDRTIAHIVTIERKRRPSFSAGAWSIRVSTRRDESKFSASIRQDQRRLIRGQESGLSEDRTGGMDDEDGSSNGANGMATMTA